MKVSFIIPTYNNEKTIKECLESILNQDFPKKDFEVLLIDGMSNDRTLEIVKNYGVRIINNLHRNEEAARILGIKKANGEILAFIDADNIIVGKDWIKKMLMAFKEKEIAFADTLYYFYRKRDKIGVRYQALIGGDDPIVTYLGFYSRWNYFKNNWTDYPYDSEDKEQYFKIRLKDKNKVPAMGSNGFLVRKNIAKKIVKDSFIHSDFVYDLINRGHNCFAKVKTGIIHNQPKFFSNKIRRMKRRANKEVKIRYNYGINEKDLFKTSIYILFLLPIIYDTLKGFSKKLNSAWFFHPIACIGELIIYGYYGFKYRLLN